MAVVTVLNKRQILKKKNNNKASKRLQTQSRPGRWRLLVFPPRRRLAFQGSPDPSEALEYQDIRQSKYFKVGWSTFCFKIQSTVIPAMVQRLFFDIIKQRDHKYATPTSWKQFYVFLATAPTGVLTAGTAGLRWKANLWERFCTFMEKRRCCTIALRELL